MRLSDTYEVVLNPILIERKSLSFDDAVVAWRLRLRGEKSNLIAAKLGTNPLRLSEVFRGEKHPEAYDIARRI